MVVLILIKRTYVNLVFPNKTFPVKPYLLEHELTLQTCWSPLRVTLADIETKNFCFILIFFQRIFLTE